MRRLVLMTACVLAGCAAPVPLAQPVAPQGLAAKAAAFAKFAPVPAAVVKRVQPLVQLASDKASERRDLEFFALPANPLGLQFADGAWIMSFLGTGKTDADVNVELRAVVSAAGVGTTMNYSGPTTLGRTSVATDLPLGLPDTTATSFELITGLPGNGVTDAYSDYMDELNRTLRQRFGAKPFAFDDAPIIFAVSRGGSLQGFVFTNQGTKLVLGERKYADVQNVVAFTADATMAAAYTIVGFNQKTTGPGAAPVFQLSDEDRLGTLAVCGDF